MPDDRALADDFDLKRLPASFYDDPFPSYRALREHAPVKRMPDGCVFLTRYDDVLAVYNDPKTFSSDKKEEFGPKYGAYAAATSITRRASSSTIRRCTRACAALIVGALSQRHIAAMEPGLVALVDSLLDAMARKASTST